MKIKNYITQAYSSIRYKSKRRGDSYPNISKKELESWLYENGLLDKWIKYIESGYDKYSKPSIDRIDDEGIMVRDANKYCNSITNPENIVLL